jgi:hypothetical protein
MLGQQIFNQKINDTNGSVSLSTLNKGLYLAEIISEGKKSTFKIVKK